MFKNLFKAKSETVFDKEDVVIGSRFYQVGGTGSRWVVERVVKPTVSEVPHVIMVREGAQPKSKMVSISAMLDTNIFRPERRDENNENIEKKNKARRRTDTRVSS